MPNSVNPKKNMLIKYIISTQNIQIFYNDASHYFEMTKKTEKHYNRTYIKMYSIKLEIKFISPFAFA